MKVFVDTVTTTRRYWFKDGEHVTTGTATVEYVVDTPDGPRWLQSNGSLGAAKHQFALAYDADLERWVREYTVPSAFLNGPYVSEIGVHSDPGLPPIEKNLFAQSATATGGHVNFFKPQKVT